MPAFTPGKLLETSKCRHRKDPRLPGIPHGHQGCENPQLPGPPGAPQRWHPAGISLLDEDAVVDTAANVESFLCKAVLLH
jgi:hypothetical protein